MVVPVLLALSLYRALATGAVSPTRLLADNLDATLSFASADSVPLFSWSLIAAANARGAAQTAALVTVARDAAFTDVVCTATATPPSTTSAACGAAAAGGAFAEPAALLFWRVCATGNDAALTVSCAASTLTVGLLPAQWVAPWAAPPAGAPFSLRRPVRLRALVPVPADTVRATLFLGSPAYYIASANGARVSDHFMGSAAEFMKRVFYDTWNVTAAAAAGNELALGVRVGPGFWGHAIPFRATTLPIRAQVHFSLANGTSIVAGAGINWAAAPDVITDAEWYRGEHVDARLEAAFAGWDTPAYSPPPGLWSAADTGVPTGLADTTLSPQDFPRIGEVATLAPSTLAQPLPGVWVFAFAQMFAGVVELTVPSPAAATGTIVTLYSGEEIFENGTVNNELFAATNETVAWTLAGTGGVEVVKPLFCFWGLQYVQVTGWPAGAPPPTLGALIGRALSSARETTGEIVYAGVVPSATIAHARAAAPSHAVLPHAAAERAAAAAERAARAASPLDAETLAGVQHASLWGGRSNWFSIPSDCPTREKRGWMGDGAASVATYTRNFALGPALRSWARSMRDNQDVKAAALPAASDGIVGFVVPDDGDSAAPKTDAAWSWAMAEVPTQVQAVYGDVNIVREGYAGLTRLLAFYEREVNKTMGIMDSQALFGDWCAAFNRSIYSPNTMKICATSTHLSMITTAATFATALGDAAAAERYTAARAAFARPFRAAYAISDEAAGTWVDALEQGPPVLALGLGADVAGNRTAAWLINDIESTHGVHQTTGSVATRFLYPLLSALGRTDLAAALAAQSTYPSPGYWLGLGATTCWEDYSGVADGSHPPPPTHNHRKSSRATALRVAAPATLTRNPRRVNARPQPSNSASLPLLARRVEL
jgi:alpha-L-rhamnosidase